MDTINLKPFLREGLDILFVGLNPARRSNRNGHYFSVNQAFWNQLHDSGLITKYVDKMYADDMVFGGTGANYSEWSYGVTDLITYIADSDSANVKPTPMDSINLERDLRKYGPRTVVLMHGKVCKAFSKHIGRHIPGPSEGHQGQLLEGCPSEFFTIAFSKVAGNH